MRTPTRNKAVETFPRREGNKMIQDRPLTPEEIEARNAEKSDLQKAREFRKRKAREKRGDG